MLFVDTGVFLHCSFFTDVDWRKCADGRDVTLAVCPAVAGEIDKTKFSDPSERTRSRAHKAMRRISELVSDHTPVQFRTGCWLWLTCRHPARDVADRGFQKDVVDDVIMACALDQQEAGNHVIVLSLDGGFRAMARSRGLTVGAIPDEWYLPDEPDKRDEQIKRLHKEVAALKAAAPKLRLTFADGKSVKKYRVRKRKPLTPEAIESQMVSLRSKFTPIDVPSVAYGGDAMLRMQNLPTRGDSIRYNNEVATFLKDRKIFLQNSHVLHEPQDRSIRFEVCLENVGTQAAEDIDIRLVATAEGLWSRKLPSLTVAPPKVPKSPRVYRLGSIAEMMYDPPNLARAISAPRKNAIARQLDPANHLEIRWHVNRAKVRLPVTLPSWYFQFPSFDEARSFTLTYRLWASNLSSPQDGALHVRIDND